MCSSIESCPKWELKHKVNLEQEIERCEIAGEKEMPTRRDTAMPPVSPPGGAIRKHDNLNNNGKDTMRTDNGTMASSILTLGSEGSRPWSPAHIYQEIAGYSSAGSASGTAAGEAGARRRGRGNNADGDKGTEGANGSFERAIRQMTSS